MVDGDTMKGDLTQPRSMEASHMPSRKAAARMDIQVSRETLLSLADILVMGFKL
jgi:hypothetical protein